MAKWRVTLSDGRQMDVYAADEATAKKQATHQETTRVVIAAKRNQEIAVNASSAFSAVKIKD